MRPVQTHTCEMPWHSGYLLLSGAGGTGHRALQAACATAAARLVRSRLASARLLVSRDRLRHNPPLLQVAAASSGLHLLRLYPPLLRGATGGGCLHRLRGQAPRRSRVACSWLHRLGVNAALLRLLLLLLLPRLRYGRCAKGCCTPSKRRSR